MIKNNKWKILISSVIILLPALFGLIVWDSLPEQIATHWGISGEADDWSSPLFVVLFLPLLLLALNFVCLLVTAKDNKNRDQSPKAFNIIFWIMPVISVYVNGIMYATAFGLELNMMALVCILLGVMFIVIGNYMPKFKQNHTMGIKISWTLANEENWYATHRFGGKVYVAAGVLFLLCAFLPPVVFPFAAILSILIATIPPAIYSYRYYKKQIREGRATEEDYAYKNSKQRKVFTAAVIVPVIATIAFCLVVCFTGNVKIFYGSSSFTVEASYWKDATVNYSDIESIEYRESGDAGERINGIGTPKLSVGWFRNDEFGNYTRYSYTGCDACVIIKINGGILVINSSDSAQTYDIYEEILSKMK